MPKHQYYYRQCERLAGHLESVGMHQQAREIKSLIRSAKAQQNTNSLLYRDNMELRANYAEAHSRLPVDQRQGLPLPVNTDATTEKD